MSPIPLLLVLANLTSHSKILKGAGRRTDLSYLRHRKEPPCISISPVSSPSKTVRCGDSLWFSCQGVSIAVIGHFNKANSSKPAMASYTIDNDQPVNFTVVNNATSKQPILTHQIIFQTPRYPPGEHELKIVYHGNAHTVPLSLSTFLVQENPQLDLQANPQQIRSDLPRGEKDAIIAISSAIAVIILLVLGFICQRWHRKRRRFASGENVILPFTCRCNDPGFNGTDKTATVPPRWDKRRGITRTAQRREAPNALEGLQNPDGEGNSPLTIQLTMDTDDRFLVSQPIRHVVEGLPTYTAIWLPCV